MTPNNFTFNGGRPYGMQAPADFGLSYPATPDLTPGGQGLNIPEGVGYSQGVSLSQFPSMGEWGSGAPVGIAPGNSSGLFGGFLNTDKQQGWGAPAMGALSGLASVFMGMKQYGLAKQQLAQSQKEFDTNFAAQKGLTNANLRDRQAARVASNPGAYQSVGDYMTANGVK